jgi:hypothetical protein
MYPVLSYLLTGNLCLCYKLVNLLNDSFFEVRIRSLRVGSFARPLERLTNISITHRFVNTFDESFLGNLGRFAKSIQHKPLGLEMGMG